MNGDNTLSLPLASERSYWSDDCLATPFSYNSSNFGWKRVERGPALMWYTWPDTSTVQSLHVFNNGPLPQAVPLHTCTCRSARAK